MDESHSFGRVPQALLDLESRLLLSTLWFNLLVWNQRFQSHMFNCIQGKADAGAAKRCRHRGSKVQNECMNMS